MKVLFVDDNEAVARSVEMALAENGHRCKTADSGQEALLLSKTGKFDIIVIDVDLPDMDGFRVVRRMKMESVKVPVIVQSRRADPALVAEARALKVADFLPKPFSIADLLDRMEDAVAARNLAAVSAEGGPEARSKAPEPPAGAKPAPRAAPAPAPAPKAEEAAAAAPETRERRRHPRRPVVEAATIRYYEFEWPCVILDMSPGGAGLRLSNPSLGCPKAFTLVSHDGVARTCTLRWHKEDRAGVEFDKTE